MWFLRKMLRVSWTERKTNESVMEEAQYKRALMNKIRKTQATFIGHVMRKKEIEHLVTTGKMEGKRGRGRPRMKMLLSLAEWSGQSNEIELLRLTNHRHKWKTMVANAGMHGTR